MARLVGESSVVCFYRAAPIHYSIVHYTYVTLLFIVYSASSLYYGSPVTARPHVTCTFQINLGMRLTFSFKPIETDEAQEKEEESLKLGASKKSLPNERNVNPHAVSIIFGSSISRFITSKKNTS